MSGRWLARATRLLGVSGIALCFPACAGSVDLPTSESERATARIVNVTDGDTIVVEIAGRRESVRLIGVDTPELGRGSLPDELGALEARDFVLRETAGGRVALANEVGREDRDDYGRLLRYVYLRDGRLLNGELVRRGYGYALTRYPFEKVDRFRRYEREAREDGAGLWEVLPLAERRLSLRQRREAFRAYPAANREWVVRYRSLAKWGIDERDLERELGRIRRWSRRLEGAALDAELVAVGYRRFR